MRKILPLLFFGLGVSGQASQEWRTFTSVDGKRTFEGKLTAFDTASNTVTVLNSKRQMISFNIEVVSENDRDYVAENAGKLSQDVNLRIRFEALRERKDAVRSNNTRSTTHDGGYTIYVNSFTQQTIADAKVEYVMIYRKDQVNGDHSDQLVKGSDNVEILPNCSAAVQTETVDLVNYYKAGTVTSSGGGCSGGSCSKGSVTATRAERSRDLLIGCVARVIVDGKVVSQSATSPDLLQKYESEFGADYEK